ncbi:MAG: DoxX family protein [Planctomycetes bacterium]|nr:DoxX family protein [Planctomycetota bacterium]MCH9727378.1 DoxX family protein [Planctomycetota bacterium]MCH9778000.1 DoxX family protein [Planctomycetota bacterium]MCH9792267.1 DoxX family protein [Planctomycetota bacterium]MDF1744071.1 DoxX family protein [Gimesia sp.]
MKDLKKITGITILFIVVLRLSIGWQLLYEGLWKIEALSSPRPWTAAGYLRNSKGPFRDHYRNMTGDPDDLNWLDAEKVEAKWLAWEQRFLNQYPNLTDAQKSKLRQMINGSKSFAAELSALPPSVKFRGSVGNAIKYDANRKRLIVDGQRHLTPAEKQRLQKMVPVEKGPNGKLMGGTKLDQEFYDAVEKVYARSARLSYIEQMRASLLGNPEVAGSINKKQEGTIDGKKIGKIEQYKKSLERYEQNLAKADQTYKLDHLNKHWAEIQGMRANLVNPIRGLEDEMKTEAAKLLTAEQIALGPVPPADTQMYRVNMLTIASLTILGIMLLVGFGTRIAAIGAAGMLMSFYLVMPPWPGVPPAPGPEHSLFVNKNIIEAIALLAIASLPTGTWFGIDGLISRFFRKKKKTTK